MFNDKPTRIEEKEMEPSIHSPAFNGSFLGARAVARSKMALVIIGFRPYRSFFSIIQPEDSP
jgi:hypothetical protein